METKELFEEYVKFHKEYNKKNSEFQKKFRKEAISVLTNDFGGDVEASEWSDETSNAASLNLVDRHGWGEWGQINHIFLASVKKNKPAAVHFNVSSESDWGDIPEDFPDDLDWSDILRMLINIKEDIASGYFIFDKETHYLKMSEEYA